MPLEDDLHQLIEKRREIDRALLERHAADMAVLFTDIVGSTAYFEQRGDIDGLALVKRHNALLFPVVTAHGGRVVKTIGDSIMAVFDGAHAAHAGIACGVALQETLAKEAGERIHIRIGVHFGRVLRDGDDVFGDTVNTAARVASAAGTDEVLVSEACREAAHAPPADGAPRASWLTLPVRAVTAKGKTAPVPVASIAWKESDKENARAVSPEARELFLLEIARGPSGLRVAAMDGEGERGTVKAYADVALTDAELDKLAEPFAVLVHDGGQSAYQTALVEKGRALFERALPERVRTRLKETSRTALRLHLEDTLVRVPWELMHDGQDFLACRFAVGRMVAAKAETAVASLAPATGAVVVLADAKGDLPHAREEGRVVARLFAQALSPPKDPQPVAGVPRTGPEVRVLDATGPQVMERSGATTRAEFLAAAVRARVLHVAGHVTKARGTESGGFVVSDGVVTTDELRDAFQGAGSVPLLAFANACHASTPSAWDAASESLAQTLLLAGVRHTLAPMWSVPDSDALSFALRFYEAALAGVPFGECVRRARRALMTTHGAPLSFAGYVLYGDPRATLPAEDAGLPMRRTRSGDFALPLTGPLAGVVPDAQAPARFADGASMRSAESASMRSEDSASMRAADSASVRFAGDAPTMGAPTPTMSASTSAAPPAMSASRQAPSRATALVTVVALVAVIVIAVIARVMSARDDEPRTPVVAADAGVPANANAGVGAIDHTGPVRVSVMPFTTTGTTDPALDAMKLGLPEVLVTAFAGTPNVRLIERGQIDVDIKEIDFAQTNYVDPATRAQLGKIVGAEIAVLGAWQLSPGPAGKEPLRFTARFVDVETGEVLAAAKVDGTRADVFGLQDALADHARKTLTEVVARVRP